MRPIPFRLTQAALLVGGVLGVHYSAETAGPLVPATDPLGTGSTSIKPNVMFILDDSGSMGSNYMPDYVTDSQSSNVTTNASTASCYDSGDDSDGSGLGTIDGRPDACTAGDPPFNSPDLNTIYYNPDIRYRPAKVRGGGADMTEQNSANTTDFTQVLRSAHNSTSTDNIRDNYPDRVWCTAKADVATSGSCRTNSGYNYPDSVFPYGETTGGAVKTINGAPYYYRARTAQYCDTAARTSCRSGSSVNPTTDLFQAPEYCTDPELTNCAAGSGVTAAHVFSGIRWCSDAGTLTKCQRKKLFPFMHPKHLGTTVNGTVPAAFAQGSINVGTIAAAGGTISNLTVNAVRVIAAAPGGNIVVNPGDTSAVVAGKIATAINGFASTPNYTATVSGSTVNVTAATAGSGPNGFSIALTTTQSGTVASRGRIQIDTAQSSQTITSVRVRKPAPGAADYQLLSCAPGSDVTFTFNNRTAYWKAGGGSNGALSRIEVSSSSSTNNDRRTAARNALKFAIDTCRGSGTPPAVLFDTANSGSYAIDLIAPVALGSDPNGWTVEETGAVNTTPTNMGGITSGAYGSDIASTTNPLSGGRTAFTGIVRIGYGSFSRVDIVPSNNSYPKASGRSDCAGASCTYQEEMTNFANWYAYYRTRMMLMKTAVGRAFDTVNEAYRVGFITICPVSGNNCSSNSLNVDVDTTNKYLRIADFATAHKTSWYDKLYDTSTTGFTPLREALSRVGLIFQGRVGSNPATSPLTGGLTNSADDPITSSCQPNFAILSTDGYWNGGPGKMYDASNNFVDVGNQDNVNTGPYSLQSQGVFDGGTPTASNTLADVALFYYKTDLRPSMNDTVPVTNKDPNNAQHMVTFTLGLGLDGVLSYRADYETAGSGDFFDVKQGTRKWPVPSAGTPSSLDDLWHAAVNGRGVFFSARDPDSLATSLTETLNQLQARVGAGAAAATSNLQPVAGDNFAFTAQYQTNDWIGDLKARTIDLSTGTVSQVTLWSAASLLDGVDHSTRRIFTFDSGDTGGNRMKHFCAAADVGAAWCNDGSGLTATELNYFNPAVITLSQEPSWTGTGTAQMLVNYLRGDDAYYNTGNSPRLATDLFRRRISILGDIVNAQPAYVKASPFAYGDAGFAEFKACTAGNGTGCPAAQFPDPSKPRRGTVYAASNDGMLHAFETDVNNNPYYQTAGIATAVTSDDTFTGNNAGNGVERWAYIPSILLPELYVLANEPYAHRYYVDGTPQVGDICLTTPCGGLADWRTILVAGFNSGGKGFYALDITNPLAPKALWEFTHTAGSCVTVATVAGEKGVPVGGPFTGDCYIGLSYGNPIITKRKKDGKWVVIITSGYNNTTPTGGIDIAGIQGQGFIYILDAATGQILNRLSTGSGTAASPSGLAKINAWATNAGADSTALAIYGGDLDGNLWRFDLDYGDTASPTPTNANYQTATRVARVKDASGNFQPITVKPELGEYATKRIILFGTGKFLETSDKTGPFTTQTIYALRDEPAVVSNTDFPATCDAIVVCNVRTDTIVRPRSFSAGATANQRSIASGTAPNWATEYGWRLDLPETGERVNVDPQLQLGTLVIASNVPTTDTCTAGGFSFINFLDYATGSYIPGTTVNPASQKIGSSLTVGLNVVMLPGGKVVSIVTTADNQQLTQDTPVPPGTFSGRRVSWRELIREQ